MVAALVKVADGDGDNWILAEVLSYTHATNKYEVDDILEEQNQKKRHILSKKYVVPLPLMRANPETDPSALFPQGTVGQLISFKIDFYKISNLIFFSDGIISSNIMLLQSNCK